MFNKLITLLFFLCVSLVIQAKQIIFLTEDLPPFQIQQVEKPPTGAMVEIIRLLIEEAGLDARIEVYPWARSYDLAKNSPNTFIFSMLRSEERERQFQWVGSLYTIKSYLAKLRSRKDITISNINDAKRYSVGTIRHDLAESYLLKKGFKANKNLYASSKYPVLWTMLYSGRTDVAFTNSIVWKQEIKAAGYNPDELTLIYEIPDVASELYLAASLSTEKQLIEKLKNSLISIKIDGRYDKILAKWHLPK